MSNSVSSHNFRHLCGCAFLIFFSAIAVYLPSIDNSLVYDDIFIVSKDVRVSRPGHLKDIWTGDYWPGNRPSYNYRPLTTTSFALAAKLSGNSVALQRWINIILHAMCSLLIFSISLKLNMRLKAALLTGLLFAIHPIHSESLFMVVGRSEMLVALFCFAFFLGILSNWNPIWLSLFFAGAILSKEHGVMLPALGILIYMLKHPDSSYKELISVTIRLFSITLPVLAIFFVMRFSVFGVLFSPGGYVDPLYNPLCDTTMAFRVINALWVNILYLKAMIWPFPLRADYSFNQIELIHSPADARFIIITGFLLIVTLLVVLKRRRLKPELLCIGLFFLALFPVSNLAVTIGVLFGERLAYLPSMGFCLFSGYVVDRVIPGPLTMKGRHVSFFLIIVLIVAACAVSVVKRDKDWQNDGAFTKALVTDSPKSAQAHGLRFLTLYKEGNHRAAETHLQKAIRIYPSYYDAWDSYGDLLFEKRRYKEAIHAYSRAAKEVAKRPHDADEAGSFLIKAAHIQLKIGDCSGVLKSIEKAKKWKSETDPRVLLLEQQYNFSPCSR